MSETPFTNAEDAWFWFIECEKYKQSGAKIISGMGVDRPCRPEDIYCAVTRLNQLGILKQYHIMTLKFFGLRVYPPSEKAYGQCGLRMRGERFVDERQAAAWWKEAIDWLEDMLIKKKIVVKLSEAA